MWRQSHLEQAVSLRVTRKPRIHHAWWIAFASSLILFVQGGLGSFAFGVLLPAWVAEFGWSRFSISIAYTVGTLLPGLSAPLVGRWTDRRGPRGLILVGAFLYGLGYVLLTGATSLVTFYAAILIGAVGRCGTGQVPVTAAIARWFTGRRALAMGIANAGISLGGMLLIPIVAWLVVTAGWRTTVGILGIAIWVVVMPITWIVMAGSPADRGMTAYGSDDARATTSTPPSITASAAVRDGRFWLIVAVMTLGIGGSNAIGLHAIPTLLDKGLDAVVGASMVSLLAGMLFVGSLLGGLLADRLPPTLVLAGALAFNGLGFTLLAIGTTTAAMWLFAVIFGCAIGAIVALQGTVIAHEFGVGAIGAIYGILSVPLALMSGASPLIAGAARDLTGSYSGAWLAFALMTWVASAGALLLFLRRPVAKPAPAI